MAQENNEELIIEAKSFFNTYKKEIGESIRKGKKVVYINFDDLSSHSPILAEALIGGPEDFLQILETALEETGLIKKPRIRFENLPETQKVKIRTIRAEHLNKLIYFEGLVRQASEVRPQVVNAKFECPSCGTVISVLQIDKKFREPHRCSCGRKGQFRLINKSMVDAQRLVIEESPESLIGGEQPRRLSIYLKEDLVEPGMEEKTTPGSKVRVLGILKEVPIPLQTGAISTRFDLAIEANNLIPLESTYEDLDISEEDERQITELAADPELFKKLRNSIAPSIWGYEEIKEALVLQMFGGVRKVATDGAVARGDIHLFLIGDPGVAKSITLKFISDMAPKGRYIVGKAASGAGITATVVRDEFLKGWSLEAGAMVLANKGVICIDEIEKMDAHDRSAMHEALEQQCMLPDFKLMLSNGKYVKIGKLVDDLINKNKKKVYKGKNCEILPVNNIKLISTDFKSSFPINAVRVSRHKAPEEFRKIILTNGKEITVTPEHPCWTVKEGKITTTPAEKMKKGMFFSIPSEIKIKAKKYKKENDYLCKILGYHLSDGCYELNRGKKNGIQFWNNDKLLIKDYKDSIKKYFNISPGITKRKHQFAVRVVSKKVVEKFQELDKCLLEKGPIKKIPEKIMQLPNKNIKHLIRALFDGDGTVVLGKRNSCRATLCAENKKLIEQVSDLLLRFKIQSSIFKDISVWKLDISGQENLKKFLTSISFLSEKKKIRLKNYCKTNKTYRTIKDIIPACSDKINEIFKKLKISARKELGHSIDLGVEKHRIFLQKLVNIAIKKLKEKQNYKEGDYCALENELNEIKKLAFGYARWMKIKEVKKIKNKNIKWVYDVTVEPFHTFISNGMILHNTVTISKANVQATLSAQTSVLAAGNPKYGRFEPLQSINQQIDLPPALINRFDLIFILRDLPNAKQDDAIASHVLRMHQKKSQKSDIDRELFRKYIAYAKQKVDPRLTDEAVDEIKNFYVKLRNMQSAGEGSGAIPISARQLQGLVRLAEAHAKTRLSPTVDKEDAKISIGLMNYYLMQVGYDSETKTFDIDRFTTNVSSSQRSKIVLLRETIKKLEDKHGKMIPLDILKKELGENLSEVDFDEGIQKLKKTGDIFQPKTGFVQLI